MCVNILERSNAYMSALVGGEYRGVQEKSCKFIVCDQREWFQVNFSSQALRCSCMNGVQEKIY